MHNIYIDIYDVTIRNSKCKPLPVKVLDFIVIKKLY